MSRSELRLSKKQSCLSPIHRLPSAGQIRLEGIVPWLDFRFQTLFEQLGDPSTRVLLRTRADFAIYSLSAINPPKRMKQRPK